MDYNEKIQYHRKTMNELQENRKKELLEKFQYLVGKCFSNGKYEMFLIKSVDYVYDWDNDTFKTNCTAIFIKFGHGKYDEIDFNYSVDIVPDDFIENSKQIFNEHFESVVKSMRGILS
jgi:hypothetical protein